MSKESVSEFKTQIERQIKEFESRKKSFKRKANWSTAIALVLGFVNTLLLALSKIEPTLGDRLTTWALIASLVGAFVLTWQKTFSFSNLWHRYTWVWSRLKAIENSLIFAVASKGESNEEVEELYKEFQRVLQDSNQYWQKVVQENHDARKHQ